MEEADASSAHKAHYRVTKNAQGQVTVKKQINRDDVERFPKGSGADPSMVDLEEYEEIEYRDGEPETISGRIKTSVSSTKQNGGHEGDSAGPDSEEYESNSHLDETLRLEGRFTLRVKGRRKRRSPRSLPGDHDRRLISSSLTAEVDERKPALKDARGDDNIPVMTRGYNTGAYGLHETESSAHTGGPGSNQAWKRGCPQQNMYENNHCCCLSGNIDVCLFVRSQVPRVT